jgi:hypothetical protein
LAETRTRVTAEASPRGREFLAEYHPFRCDTAQGMGAKCHDRCPDDDPS